MVSYEDFVNLANEYKCALDCFSFKYHKEDKKHVAAFVFKNANFVLMIYSDNKITIKTNLTGQLKEKTFDTLTFKELLNFVEN